MDAKDGAVPGDVGALFVQATGAVSAPRVHRDEKIQFIPGDMYKSCNTCAFLASTTFPDSNKSTNQYACVPLQLHMFILGPMVCDPHSLAVLVTIKEWTAAAGGACRSKTHLAVYAPCSGTLFFQGDGAPVPVHGSREDLHFRAKLPLQAQTGSCALNVTHVQMERLDPCTHLADRTWFDEVLQQYLAEDNGFVYAVDWTCLLRIKYLAGTGSGLLPTSTTAYQARIDENKRATYILCECPNTCGGCDAGSTSLDVCSTDASNTCGGA